MAERWASVGALGRAAWTLSRMDAADRPAGLRLMLLRALVGAPSAAWPLSAEEAKLLLSFMGNYTPAIAVDCPNARMFISPKDAAIGYEVFTTHQFDEIYLKRALDLIERHAGKRLNGGTLVDIGANIGTVTIPALTKFGARHVIAFEPMEDVLSLLRASIAANDLAAQVTLHAVALSDAAGEVSVELCDVPGFGENWGDRRIRVTNTQGELGEEGWKTVRVRTQRLDTYSIDWVSVAMVVMDVQGHEANVMQGAGAMLSSGVPIVTEYSPYLLSRAGGIDAFHRIVADNYRVVHDLRSGESHDGADIAELAQHYQGARAHTDLVLMSEALN